MVVVGGGVVQQAGTLVGPSGVGWAGTGSGVVLQVL